MYLWYYKLYFNLVTWDTCCCFWLYHHKSGGLYDLSRLIVPYGCTVYIVLMIVHFPFLLCNWHFSHSDLLFGYRCVKWEVCNVTDTSRFKVAAVLANFVILRRINYFLLVDSLIVCGCLNVHEEKQIWGLYKMSIGFILGLGNIYTLL